MIGVTLGDKDSKGGEAYGGFNLCFSGGKNNHFN